MMIITMITSMTTNDKSPATYIDHLSTSWKRLRYNVSGFVEELPQMPQERFVHSCGTLPTGVRPALITWFHKTGVNCCWRMGTRIHPPCLGADAPPWVKSLDSPCLPPTSIGLCSCIGRGRNTEADWGTGWCKFSQSWGDSWIAVATVWCNALQILWFQILSVEKNIGAWQNSVK